MRRPPILNATWSKARDTSRQRMLADPGCRDLWYSPTGLRRRWVRKCNRVASVRTSRMKRAGPVTGPALSLFERIGGAQSEDEFQSQLHRTGAARPEHGIRTCLVRCCTDEPEACG